MKDNNNPILNSIEELTAKVREQEREIFLLRGMLIKYVGMVPMLESPDKDHILQTPIRDFSFSPRVITVLEKAYIYTVGDLHEHSRRQISIIRGLGPKGLDEVDQFFKYHGLHYAEEF